VKRAAKGDGYGNVFLEEVPVPSIRETEVLVKTHTTLISRGSEILRRYRNTGPVDASTMGYSVAGTVEEVGAKARDAGYAPGDRVFAMAPHAEYVAVDSNPDNNRLLKVPADMPWERIPYLSLVRGGVAWAIASRATPQDTVVVLGQGLVGNLLMQAHRARGVARMITVDTLAPRVALSQKLGADETIDAGQVDAVAEVRRLTGGKGADVVVDCVGGAPGVRSFEQALDMVKDDGIIHLIGLYQGQPLQLDANKIQRKLLIGGYHLSETWPELSALSLELMTSGKVQVDPLTTHRFPASQAAEAFALLDQRIDQAFGVLLDWSHGV
jgi:threonine dehydrogenase-like Zn-dependent dehydrogenase